METLKQPSALAFALKSAAMLGLVAIVYSTIGVLTKQAGELYWGIIDFLITSTLCFFFIKNFRDKASAGYLSFGKAFSVGFQMMLYAALIGLAYGFVMKYVLFPAYFEQVRIAAEQKVMANRQLSDEQIESALKLARMFSSPGIVIVLGIVGSAFVSSILALILAAILKKEPPRTFADA